MKIDVLGREQYVQELLELTITLSNNRSNCCFTIDGEWGIGKTFVLEMFEEEMENIISEETNDNKFYLFHYNCWQYDYYDEPSIAIVSSMLETAKYEISLWNQKEVIKGQAAWETVKNHLETIAGEFIKNKIGINLVELYRDYKQNEDGIEEELYKFDELFAFRETLEKTKLIIGQIAKEKTIVIVVDELDRCVPQYAIKVLERLHHIFNEVENVIVIISIDSKQIEHSIKEIYGPDTEVKKYLRKFISFSKKLDTGVPDLNILTKYDTYFKNFLFEDSTSIDKIHDFFSILCEKIDIRTQEKIVDKSEMLHKMIFGTECIGSEVLLVELLITRYHFQFGDANLKWILEMQNTEMGEKRKCIGNKSYTYLKKFVEFGKSNVSKSELRDGLPYTIHFVQRNGVGKVVYLISRLFDRDRTYESEEYYSEEIVEKLMDYVRLSNLINN